MGNLLQKLPRAIQDNNTTQNKENLTSTQPRAQAPLVFIGTIIIGNLCSSSMKFSAHNVTISGSSTTVVSLHNHHFGTCRNLEK